LASYPLALDAGERSHLCVTWQALPMALHDRGAKAVIGLERET